MKPPEKTDDAYVWAEYYEGLIDYLYTCVPCLDGLIDMYNEEEDE